MEPRNPFADYGTTVTDGRFLGREEELRQIDSRIFGPGGYGSLALVGLPRIGKTSLVGEAVRRAEPRLAALRAVVVRLDVGACGSVEELFRTLVEDVVEEIRARLWSTERIESASARALADGDLVFQRLQNFFRAVRQAGVRAVCVLDEFDAGRYLFSGAPQCFHWLRELCSNPEFKAAVVLVSKRRFQDVARLAGHESDYWANVLMAMTLRPFTSDEVDLFGKQLAASGVVAEEETYREVAAVCGQHPYLLDAYAYLAWQGQSQGRALTVDWFRTTMRAVVRDYYQQVVTILEDASTLGKFVQVMVGPQWNVTPDDLDAMVDYGVLHVVESGGRLRSFSSGFDEYVRFVEGSVEIWPLWRDTERVLRDGLERALTRRFGDGWAQELARSFAVSLRVVSSSWQRNRLDSARGRRRRCSPTRTRWTSSISWLLTGQLLGSRCLGLTSRGGPSSSGCWRKCGPLWLTIVRRPSRRGSVCRPKGSAANSLVAQKVGNARSRDGTS